MPFTMSSMYRLNHGPLHIRSVNCGFFIEIYNLLLRQSPWLYVSKTVYSYNSCYFGKYWKRFVIALLLFVFFFKFWEWKKSRNLIYELYRIFPSKLTLCTNVIKEIAILDSTRFPPLNTSRWFKWKHARSSILFVVFDRWFLSITTRHRKSIVNKQIAFAEMIITEVEK